MKTLFTLSFFLIAFAGTAQTRHINYDSVKAAVTDPAKDTYYPKLLQRFNRFDTTLTLEDYRLLYYGYAFDTSYYPYINDGGTEIMQFVKKRKYDKALEECDKVLAKKPTAVTTNSYKSFVLMNMAENDSARFYGMRHEKLINAIFSSGDGLTCETAFRVIYVSDEYMLMRDILKVNNLLRTTQPPCDKWKVSKSDSYPSNTIYFDLK